MSASARSPAVHCEPVRRHVRFIFAGGHKSVMSRREFHKEQTEAVQIMLHVHKKGIGVAGVYTYEIAETKVALVENLSRQHEYPLKCTMEEA